MKIDKRLNLEVPIERDDGTTIYTHTMPLSREVFERYFLLISKTFAAIYSEGLSVIAGPRIAAMMVRKIAADMDIAEDVEAGLIGEIRRLTNIVALTTQGWKPVMLDNAIAQKLITADEWAEAEGAIVFFIVASAMHTRTQLPSILGGLSQLWGAQALLPNCTEFAASLPTSTAEENSGETAPKAAKGSLIPT